MRQYSKLEKKTKRIMMAAVMAVSLLSVTPAYAAGLGVSAAHDLIYRTTEQMEQTTATGMELEEHFISGAEDHSYEVIEYDGEEDEMIMPLLDENEMDEFTWLINPNTRHVTARMKLDVGQVISVTCNTMPADAVYWLGIMNSDGDVLYVEGTGPMAHSFEITEKDSYRVLVQNPGKEQIISQGTYYYYTKEEEN